MYLCDMGGIVATFLFTLSSFMLFPFSKFIYLSSTLFDTDDRLFDAVGKTEMKKYGSSSMESFLIEKSFRPRSTDIIISTPPKTGANFFLAAGLETKTNEVLYNKLPLCSYLEISFIHPI